jgi:hypothetical protein
MQSKRDDLAERLSFVVPIEGPVSEYVYGERAKKLHQMAEAETDPTLRGNLLMLAERYAELGGIAF